MDVSFIKKEEPAEYTLISTCEDQHTYDDFPSAASMDIYTIKFKEEPTDVYQDKKHLDDATTESETSDYAPESEDTDDESYGDESDIFEKETADKNSFNSMSSKSKEKRWECKRCFRTFRRRCLLITHMKNHRNLSEMEFCTICRKYYPKSSRGFHLSLHNDPPYVCLVCGKEFACREKYRCHNKIHREKLFKCDICHKSFLSKSLLSSHMQIHQEREKTFECHVCKLSFFRKNTLLRHIRNIHTRGPRMKYKCTKLNCNREYVREGDLLRHKCLAEKPLPERCPTCDISFDTSTAMKLHCRRYHSQDFKILFCHKCKKTFRGYDNYVLHTAQNCPDIIMLKCDLCLKSIGGKIKLLSHFANYHRINALRTLPCTVCGKTFATKRRLTSHLQVHEKQATTKKKTYECMYCSRLFLVKSQSIRHMNSSCTLRKSFDYSFSDENDLNKKKYECDICGYTYTQKCAIFDHMQIMHSTISISGRNFWKKFNCPMNQRIVLQYPCCDENVIDDRVNEKHVVKDTCTFLCRKCKKQYANLYSLLRHCAEHTSKVHQSLRHLQQCKTCDRIFKWKRSIPEHLQSLEERLKCVHCQKEFKFKAHYNNHANKCKLK